MTALGGSRTLVTGASGLSGAAIVRELSRQRLPVRALVRSQAKASALVKLPEVDVQEGDMLRPETLERAFDGVDRAVLISSSTPQMFETQRTFIDAARNAGVRHVLKFSGKESNKGFDQSRFRFTRMHRQIEQYLEGSGLAWTHLRPSQFMQVYLREAPTIAAKAALFLPLEGVSLAPIDVDDIAGVVVALLKGGPVHEGKGYDLTGPEALTMADIAERISEATGTPVRFVPVTPQERRDALIATGLPLFIVDALDEQAKERLRCPEAGVDVAIARSLDVRLATFDEFARRHATEFRGGAPGRAALAGD